MGELDRELFRICQPPYTKKMDFSRSPNVDLGTGVCWTLPVIEAGKIGPKDLAAGVIEHVARFTIFFCPEAGTL